MEEEFKLGLFSMERNNQLGNIIEVMKAEINDAKFIICDLSDEKIKIFKKEIESSIKSNGLNIYAHFVYRSFWIQGQVWDDTIQGQVGDNTKNENKSANSI